MLRQILLVTVFLMQAVSTLAASDDHGKDPRESQPIKGEGHCVITVGNCRPT